MRQARAGAEPYWYGAGDAEARGLLEAVRTFRHADDAMRQRASRDMDMNASDLRALRLVIDGERSGEPVTPRALATHLDISTAATTKLVDRLCASGHLERRPHPSDRRSVVMVATLDAHDEVRERLGRMHARMLDIAREVPVGSRAAVRDFLLALAAELGREDDDAATHLVTALRAGRTDTAPGGVATPVD
ncbi:MarR family winged helix-turn-helix transcriptional regulator [Isoptericola croceus]|uniref:MarR family winged helix-turn-helix transcriptional regulator n=1 Tax=Isoptericola croceus TaxID=3031406 RepID=UPI0023F8BCC7|nr:MarR family transcriptional regulator [Isoptericola croceus]